MIDQQHGFSPEAIAVVGFAGRFPGAENTRQFWRNIRQGVNSVELLDRAELLARGADEHEITKPDYVPAVGLMPDADRFDADLFGVTPREAALHDPHHRAFLEAVHEALENAGYDPFAETAPTGVFGGSSGPGYLTHHVWGNVETGRVEPTTLGIYTNPSFLPTFTSYKLSLTGPSVAVATACSTSLVALDLAAEALRRGACGIAVAGAAEIEFPFGQGYRWQPGSIHSRDGVCRPFDAAANGTVFTSGVAVVVLKLLDDALRDGDTIRAVIRGSAVNNDGSDKVSFGAPSVSGQIAAVKAAMTRAEVRPEDIDYVEAHGTGTKVGDPLEISALAQAYAELSGAPLPPGTIPIGSVKSNVGHLGPASGLAGLIKVAQSLEHQEIPATINYREPNPAIDFGAVPFFVNDSPRPWPSRPDRPRRAAVSSFGVGGTNTHLIVEEPPAVERAKPLARPQLIVWSSRTRVGLDQTEEELADHLRTSGQAFDDVAHTLEVGRSHHPVRAAAVAESAREAAELLGSGSGSVRRSPETASERQDVCFVFPGQGSQRARMAEGLYEGVPGFAQAFDECLDLFAEHDLMVRDAWRSEDPAELDRTDIAQAALFSVEYAMSQALEWAGIRPVAVLGHSVGEIVAATVAGVFDLADAVRVVAARGRLMARASDGAMLAAAISQEDLTERNLEGVWLAAVNGAGQVTLSGGHKEIAAAQAFLEEDGVRCQPLRTAHAFHSPAMAEAAEHFETVVDQIELNEPGLRVVSAATGADLSPQEARSPAFWARQLVEPVLFHPAVDHLLGEGEHLVIEVGPGQSLSGLVRQHPTVVRGASSVVPASPRVPGADADERAFLAALGALYVAGHDLDRPKRDGTRVPLPGYAYQRERHWMAAVDRTAPAGETRALSPAHDEKAEEGVPAQPPATGVSEQSAVGTGPTDPPTLGTPPVVSPFAALQWHENPLPVTAAALRPPGRVLALLPRAFDDARQVLGALHKAGHHVFRVRAGDRLELGEEEFTVRPNHPDDLEAVLARLQARDALPHTYVHAWTVADWEPATPKNLDDQLAGGFLSLLNVMRLSARRPAGGSLPEVVVFSSGAVDVSGAETPHPVKSTLVGLTVTFPQEAPGRRCRLIDVGGDTDARLLADELLSDTGSGIVAWRGARRWERSEREIEFESRDAAALREEGVYVITGGLGGLGLETAKGLVRKGIRPRLALLGRRVPEGDRALPPAEGDRVRTAVAEMEALGAQIRLLPCDITVEAEVEAAVDAVISAFGPINGVVHCAGVAGDGVIELRDTAEALAVLRPKVLGSLLLRRALAEQRPDPDFFVSYSSRSGTHGLIGSGDYSAANAFLDSDAATPRGRTRTLSVGWPSWRQVGMAAPGTPTPDEAEERGRPEGEVVWEEVYDSLTHWELDEHRLGTTPVMPGTGQLDLALRAWADRGDTRAARRLEKVTFHRPLEVTSPRCVQVLARGGQDVDRFVIRSRPVDGEAWTEHTTGSVRLVESVARFSDPEALAAELSGEQPPAPEPETGLVAAGPRWNCLGETIRGADADLVELVLPESFLGDLSRHQLHPALLDVATAFAQRPSPFAKLPWYYESITVFGALPARFHAHMRYRPGRQHGVTVDVDLIAPDGQVLVAVEGYTMVRVDPDAWRDGRRGAAGERPGTSRPLPGAVTEESGLEPHQGVHLFLTLLESVTPPHVLVRPYENGAPVPAERPRELPQPRTVVVAPSPAPVEQTAVETPRSPLPEAAPGTKRPAESPVSPTAVGTEAEDEIATAIRGFWEDALGMRGIKDDDDFFELGGNSLSSIELMGQIRERFGVELSVAMLFECPTVSLLAEAVRAGRDA
ncbi:type I polyketide synthase [Streptomyces sedi]|uniref:type I polyketide synthase n=1 Tax=Streptomyces sedi TaxID=555059 RepID=UPI001477431D|nr:type I polyketide synthase [Streptomyces sedi]